MFSLLGTPRQEAPLLLWCHSSVAPRWPQLRFSNAERRFSFAACTVVRFVLACLIATPRVATSVASYACTLLYLVTSQLGFIACSSSLCFNEPSIGLMLSEMLTPSPCLYLPSARSSFSPYSLARFWQVMPKCYDVSSGGVGAILR